MLKSIDYVGLISEIEPKRTQAGYAGYTQGPHLYIEYWGAQHVVFDSCVATYHLLEISQTTQTLHQGFQLVQVLTAINPARYEFRLEYYKFTFKR